MFRFCAILGLASTTLATPQADVCKSKTEFPWCDHSLRAETRAQMVVKDLTKDEKASLLTNGASAIPRINWPAYNWWSEALHGVARDGVATSFPQICGVAASYNKTLWHAIGDVTGTEGRGKNNDVEGGMYHALTFWAPNVNIFRDPRWGRGEETPGEDPTMNGDYAEAFVTGMQGDGSSGFIKASACLKHYVAYNLETGRNDFAAVVSNQDMEDTYLPAFEAGVTKGNASGMMCSYNAETWGEGIYGPGSAAQKGAIPSCANKGILNDLARAKWGFNGYITSDCGAVSNVQNNHKYTSSPNQTVKAVLSAGMDTDCGGFMSSKTMSPLMKDESIEALVDTALQHLFTVQFRLGFGTPDSLVPWAKYGNEVVNTPAHQQLALEAAQQSLVLLKNEGAGSLPWKAGGKIAVIGRNANATQNMLGNYFGTPPFIVSPAEGISKFSKTTVLDGTDIPSAVAAVDKVDAVILVVGLTSEGSKHPDEAEGHDRTSLLYPQNQSDLINAVATASKAKGKPVVVVTMGGGPVDVTFIKENSAISSLIWCGYPGQSGGTAIANAVFGKTNSFGKLSLTWYPENFVNEVSIFDMGMRPNKTTGNPGRTYRFYTGTPVYKFGSGLSYTTFSTSVSVSATVPQRIIEAELGSLRKDTSVVATVEATVRNTGNRDGDEVLQIFVSPPNAGHNGAPLRSMVAYERFSISAGDSVNHKFNLQSHHFTYSNSNGVRMTVPGAWRVWAGADGEGNAIEMQVV